MERVPSATMVIVLAVLSMSAAAQPQPRGAGHWVGTLQTPVQQLKVEIDLMKTGEKWDGTMGVPDQKLKGLPLSVAVDGDTVTFAAKLPGDPQFKGKLSTDGQSLTGDFTQGGGTIPLSLTRSGDAKIEPMPKSTVITKELEGSWEGTLDVKGTLLRLVLKLSRQADGMGSGSLVSVDQGGVEIPITVVVQTGTQLSLLIPTIAGAYEGQLKDGVLTGTWTQGPLSLPLVFKRSK